MKKVYSIIFFLLLYKASLTQEIPKWKIGQLEQFIENSSKPLIINFWATFCKPCIEEVPDFQKIANLYKKDTVQFLLVSLDLPEDYNKIKKFLVKRKISIPVVYLDETNADLFCPRIDLQWSGGIPATLFINNRTSYRRFYDTQLSEIQLEKQIKQMINSLD